MKERDDVVAFSTSISLFREVTKTIGLGGSVASSKLNGSCKRPVDGLHPGQVCGHDLVYNWPFEY